MQMKHIFGAAAIVVSSAFAVSAATVNTTSNVVFIVDESGSMSGEHSFLQDVIDNLDSALAAEGVTSRSYGVVGFGGNFTNPGSPRRVGGDLTDATTTKANLGGLFINGGTEDGYSGIDFAISSFNYTPGAAINYVLVTDEDRDNTDNALSYSSVLASLTSRNILLNAVVDARFRSASNTTALGLNDGEAYVADGSGGFNTSAGGSVVGGAGTTVSDYVNLALATGGAAWDLNQLRAGGLSALSFTNAFIDIKVDEITTQPPSPSPIPVPAAFPLLLGGLGLMGVVSRRRRNA